MADFPVTPSTRVERYEMTGGETSLPIGWPVFAAGDIRVVRRRSGADVTLVLDTDYSVSGIGAAAATVTLTLPAIAGDLVAIVGAMPIQRVTDYVESGDFTARAVNGELDRMTAWSQELARQMGQSLRLPDTDPPPAVLPAAPDRIGRLLGFDAAGALSLFGWPVPVPAATLETLAALRVQPAPAALVAPVLALTLARSVPADGGGGAWRWAPASTEADDDGTVIRPTAISAAAPGRWLRIITGPIRPEWWGRCGDGRLLDDVELVAGSTVITSASAGWTAEDVGRIIGLPDVALPVETAVSTIVEVLSGSQARINNAARRTGTVKAVVGSDAYPPWQRALDWVATRGGTVEPLPGRHVSSDHPRWQDRQPPEQMAIDGRGAVTLHAAGMGAFGGALLIRNSYRWTVRNLDIDAGGDQGLHGANCIGISGLNVNGRDRSYAGVISSCRFRRGRIGPEKAGAKAVSCQAGNRAVLITGCLSDGCDMGFALEATVTSAREGILDACEISACQVRNAPYGGLWLSAATNDPIDPADYSARVSATLVDCGGPGAGTPVTAGNVDPVTDIITAPGHGLWSRDTLIVDGAAPPGGLADGGQVSAIRVDHDRLMLAASTADVTIAQPANISPLYDQVTDAGHAVTTKRRVVYLCQTGHHGTSIPDSTTPGGLTSGAAYHGIKTGPNTFALVSVADPSPIRTLAPAAINLGTGVWTIDDRPGGGHGLATGTACRLSIGAGTSPITAVPQLTAIIQGVALVGITGTVAAGAAAIAVNSTVGITVGSLIRLGSVQWQGPQASPTTWAQVIGISGLTVTVDRTAVQAATDAAMANNVGQAVPVGTTEASGNDQYKPQSLWYWRSLTSTTGTWHRSADDAAAGANPILYGNAGSGTLGCVPAADLVDITSQGSGYQIFACPVDLTGTGDCTLWRRGFGAVMLNRAWHTDLDVRVYDNRDRPADLLVGRMSHSRITVLASVRQLGRLWDMGVHGSRGVFGSPGTDGCRGNLLRASMRIGRLLRTKTVTATTGSGTVAFTDVLEASHYRIGDRVTFYTRFDGGVLPGQPGGTAYEVIATGDGTITVAGAATSSGSTFVTPYVTANAGPAARLLPGLVAVSTTTSLDPQGTELDISVSGYPLGVPLITAVVPGLTLRCLHQESGSDVETSTTYLAQAGITTPPSFQGVQQDTIILPIRAQSFATFAGTINVAGTGSPEVVISAADIPRGFSGQFVIRSSGGTLYAYAYITKSRVADATFAVVDRSATYNVTIDGSNNLCVTSSTAAPGSAYALTAFASG